MESALSLHDNVWNIYTQCSGIHFEVYTIPTTCKTSCVDILLRVLKISLQICNNLFNEFDFSHHFFSETQHGTCSHSFILITQTVSASIITSIYHSIHCITLIESGTNSQVVISISLEASLTGSNSSWSCVCFYSCTGANLSASNSCSAAFVENWVFYLGLNLSTSKFYLPTENIYSL